MYNQTSIPRLADANLSQPVEIYPPTPRQLEIYRLWDSSDHMTQIMDMLTAEPAEETSTWTLPQVTCQPGHSIRPSKHYISNEIQGQTPSKTFEKCLNKPHDNLSMYGNTALEESMGTLAEKSVYWYPASTLCLRVVSPRQMASAEARQGGEGRRADCNCQTRSFQSHRFLLHWSPSAYTCSPARPLLNFSRTTRREI